MWEWGLGGRILPPTRPLETYLVIIAQREEQFYWPLVDRGKITAKQPAMHRTAPTTESSGSKCQ